MDPFAVLSPTDPQTLIKLNDDETMISTCFYKRVIDGENRPDMNLNEALMMEEQIQCYEDTIRTFKKLKMVRFCEPYKSKNIDRQKVLLETFCDSSLPHHTPISVNKLRELSIDIKDMTSDHESILKKLDICKKFFGY